MWFLMFPHVFSICLDYSLAICHSRTAWNIYRRYRGNQGLTSRTWGGPNIDFSLGPNFGRSAEHWQTCHSFTTLPGASISIPCPFFPGKTTPMLFGSNVSTPQSGWLNKRHSKTATNLTHPRRSLDPPILAASQMWLRAVFPWGHMESKPWIGTQFYWQCFGATPWTHFGEKT